MDSEFLLVLFSAVAHLLIFTQSKGKQRKRNLVQAMVVLLLSVTLFFSGLFIGLGGHYNMKVVVYGLLQAPLVLSALSFLVYLKRK